MSNYQLGNKPLYKNTIENYFPLHNGLLLETVTVQEKTESGIYLPESVVEHQKNTVDDSKGWRVIKVGPEVVNIKEGDFVIFGKATPIGVDLEGELYLQIFENWVCGVFREGATTEDFKASPILVGMPEEESAIPTDK